MSKSMQLSLKGDTFSALQEDFDAILARTVGNMEMKGADEATITLKLKVTLEKATARDFESNGYDATRDITKPSFSHDISSMMQVKDKRSGALRGDYELVWDNEAGQYYMRKIEDGQVNMDDVMDDYEVVSELPKLPESTGLDGEDEDTEDEYGWEQPDEEE